MHRAPPPLPSLIADAAAALAGGAAGLAALGGPLGLAGAVPAGAAAAWRIGPAHHRRWLARLLDRPCDPELFPAGQENGAIALAALAAAPIFRRVWGEAVLAKGDRAAASALLAAARGADAAERIARGGPFPPAPAGEGGPFASAIELEEGLAQFRRAVLDQLLDRTDATPITVPLPAGAVTVPQPVLRAAIDAARAWRAAAAALDRLILAVGLAREPAIDLAATLARAAAGGPEAAWH